MFASVMDYIWTLACFAPLQLSCKRLHPNVQTTLDNSPGKQLLSAKTGRWQQSRIVISSMGAESMLAKPRP
jgi:hypothetical protein